ncbi:MAG: hypothetical protein GF315_10710, partial [candidate division Zixibacteria bacterium]|nr:hypothetical protein [candidate division Zixibacteria bacterium]
MSNLSKFKILIVIAVAVLISSGAQATEPTFVYETTIPGYFLPASHGVTVDDEGNAYVIGRAYEDEVRLDVMVYKLSPEGDVLWTRFIVGAEHDQPEDIKLDSNGDVWVIGWTGSEDFPTTPDAFDNTLTGF